VSTAAIGAAASMERSRNAMSSYLDGKGTSASWPQFLSGKARSTT